MRLRGPVDAHEPVALVLHHADPHAVGAAAMLTGPCTGAQGRRLPTGPSPRPLAGARVPLYWRSRAQTPHGAFTAATRRGTRPPQVLEAQGVVGRSRQVGPIRTDYDSSIRITMRRTGGKLGQGDQGTHEAADAQRAQIGAAARWFHALRSRQP